MNYDDRLRSIEREALASGLSLCDTKPFKEFENNNLLLTYRTIKRRSLDLPPRLDTKAFIPYDKDGRVMQNSGRWSNGPEIKKNNHFFYDILKFVHTRRYTSVDGNSYYVMGSFEDEMIKILRGGYIIGVFTFWKKGTVCGIRPAPEKLIEKCRELYNQKLATSGN